MSANTKEYGNAEYEIQKLLESGSYKTVDFSLFNNINQIKLSPATLKHYRFILEIYKDYLKEIMNLSSFERKKYLETLRNADILDNHKLTKENSFLMELYLKTQENNIGDEIIKRANGVIYQDGIKYIHFLLMEGASSNSKDHYNFRSNDHKFVGEYIDGKRIIQYFPLPYKDTELAIEEVLAYYNNRSNENEETLLVKPFIIHGLIAALQLFDDGNSRLARLFQHIKLWHMTNDSYNLKLDLPSIYITRSSYPFRGKSRELINNLVENADDDAWNKWINFNLNRFEDQIYYNNNNLHSLNKLLKK